MRNLLATITAFLADNTRYILPAVVVLVALLYPKSCGVDNQEEKVRLYKEYISQKQEEVRTLQRKAQWLENKLIQDSVNRMESEKKYLAKVTILEKKVTEARKLAEPIIQKNDTLKQWAQAVDSVNAAKDARIQQLKEEARISSLICRDLTTVKVKELAVAHSIDADKDGIIKAQGKVIRKLKAGRVLRNIAIPVLTVGAFILGVKAAD